MKSSFMDLLRESVIIQGVIAIVLIGGFVYLTVKQIPIPDDFKILVFTAVGFYFGGAFTKAMARNTQAAATMITSAATAATAALKSAAETPCPPETTQEMK